MDVSSLIQLITLTLQAAGIVVGTGVVLELALRSKYVNAIMRIVNVTQDVNRQ